MRMGLGNVVISGTSFLRNTPGSKENSTLPGTICPTIHNRFHALIFEIGFLTKQS